MELKQQLNNKAEFFVKNPDLINNSVPVTIKCGDYEPGILTLERPSLEAISLSIGADSIITATSYPLGAKLPAACTTSLNLEAKTNSATNVTKAEFKLKQPVTTDTEVTVNCGDGKKTASLTLYPDTEQVKNKFSTTDVTKSISTLTLTVKHPEQAAGGNIDYFVAAHIPQFAYPFEQANDEWAFLALPETGTDAANWKVLFLATSLDNLAFKKGVAIPTGNQVTLPINLQLPIDALKSYDAKLYLGYRQGANGSFKALANPIWQANTP